MAKDSKPNTHSIAFELTALAQLLQYWAGCVAAGERVEKVKKKLPLFRQAVATGMGKGASETIPHELVRDEYFVIKEVAYLVCKSYADEGPANVRAWLSQLNIVDSCECSPGVHLQVGRPCPIPTACLDEVAAALASGTCKPNDLALTIVASRLAIVEETVRNARKRTAREKTKAEHRLLVSLYLDWISYVVEENAVRVAGTILDALSAAGYPEICLYYLAQISCNVPRSLAVRCPSTDTILRLCSLLGDGKGYGQSGSFAALL